MDLKKIIVTLCFIASAFGNQKSSMAFVSWAEVFPEKCPLSESGKALSLLNGEFESARVQEEIVMGLNQMDVRKKTLHFANALQLSMGVPADQFCLYFLFDQLKQKELASQAKSALFTTFVTQGGSHSRELSRLFSDDGKEKFRYWKGMLELFKGDYSFVLSFWKQTLYILKIFLFLCFFFFFLYLLFNHNQREVPWKKVVFFNKFDARTKLGFLFGFFCFLLWVHPLLGFWGALFYWLPILSNKTRVQSRWAYGLLCLSFCLQPFSQFFNSHQKTTEEKFRIAAPLPAMEQRPKESLLQCLHFFKKGDVVEMASALETFRYESPDHPWLPLLEGAMYFLEESYANAAKSFQEATHEPELSEIAYYNLHHAYLRERSLSSRTIGDKDLKSNRTEKHDVYLSELPEVLQSNHNVQILFPMENTSALIFKSAFDGGFLWALMFPLLSFSGFFILNILRAVAPTSLHLERYRELRYRLNHEFNPLFSMRNKNQFDNLLPSTYHGFLLAVLGTWVLWELSFGSALRSLLPLLVYLGIRFLLSRTVGSSIRRADGV